jgi:hypothetical protein
MTTPNFNFQELHDFLFESNIKIDNNRKTEEYDLLWQGLGGEYNVVSEFVEACKLIVMKNALANSIEDSSMKQSSLSAFIGDITPAAAAVVAADESPIMNTPFLDNSCMNTPFTPATVFTPSLAQFQNSPYYSPYIESSVNQNLLGIDFNQDDIQVAKYLKTDMPWQGNAADLFAQTPAIASTDVSSELLNSIETFNGDPTQLILNSNTVDNTVAATSSNDSLFPPLPSDDTSYSLNNNIQPDQLFNSRDFDSTNLFEDDCFDGIFDLHDEPSVMQPPTTTPLVTKQLEPIVISKKRKNEDNKTSKKNKRVKVAPSSALVEKDQDERKFECNICHTFFNRRYNLGTHVKTHDKNRNKDFECHLCKKPFDRKHDLTRHIATVHNHERAYGCKQCSSTFSRKDALVRHCLQKHNYEA